MPGEEIVKKLLNDKAKDYQERAYRCKEFACVAIGHGRVLYKASVYRQGNPRDKVEVIAREVKACISGAEEKFDEGMRHSKFLKYYVDILIFVPNELVSEILLLKEAERYVCREESKLRMMAEVDPGGKGEFFSIPMFEKHWIEYTKYYFKE